jgi:dihydroorotate dehydrogenase (fumarate)
MRVKFEDAGADAIELNLYQLVTDRRRARRRGRGRHAGDRAQCHLGARAGRGEDLGLSHGDANFAMLLQEAGAQGLVLFNRFYQPDFNIEDLEVEPQLKLSDSSELLMRLRWLAIISPNFRKSVGRGFRSPPGSATALGRNRAPILQGRRKRKIKRTRKIGFQREA